MVTKPCILELWLGLNYETLFNGYQIENSGSIMKIHSPIKMAQLCQILFVSVFILYPNVSHSQEYKDFLRAEAGIAFCGSGDMNGKVFSLAYIHHVYKNLYVSPDIEFASFKQIVQPNSTISAISYSGAVNLVYRKNITERNIFETSLGGYLNQFNWSFVTSSNSMNIKGIEVPPYSQKSYQEKLGVGYQIRIGSVFSMSKSDLGIFYCLQNDTNGNIVHSLRLSVAYKIAGL